MGDIFLIFRIFVIAHRAAQKSASKKKEPRRVPEYKEAVHHQISHQVLKGQSGEKFKFDGLIYTLRGHSLRL